ncbi:MAG: endolytic transglycosylase MltG [Deltaproteobacteria bacterium]|nr:endolytic transglycosylase MltG [Deltaproteobacteria bacterium]
MTRRLTVLALGVIVAVISGLVWLLLVYPDVPGPRAGRNVELVLSEVGDAERLAERLAGEGIVEDPNLFLVYLRLLGGAEVLRRGRVQLDDGMTPRQVAASVAATLGEGRMRILFPEGFTRYDVAARLADYHVCGEDEFIRATEDSALLAELEVEGPSAEGYLFPDTYELTTDQDPRDVVSRMVENFWRRVRPVLAEHDGGLGLLRGQLAFGLPEVLTMASIVEKEAAVSDERPRIAGVFLNRLRSETFRPQRLQADPTVSYGCRVDPDRSEPCRAYEGGAPSRAMLRDRSNPYNTYRIEGLPPGPIANPGISSIRGVLAAEEHEYLYFVARGGGRHYFSATLEEHDAAVDRYLR